MKDKKILFMGGKYIGCECLQFLIKKGFHVIGCYINLDDDASSLSKSISNLCKKNKIPIFCYPDVNSIESEKNILQLSPDIITIVYFHQILKPNIINIPPIGCINLHLALSQIHRGCYPTTWSLIRGDEYTGVTLHFITEKIDKGPIIAQRKLKIKEDWTGKDLYYKLSDIGISLFKECFPKLDKLKSYTIDNSRSKYYKREFPSREIQLDKATYNRIRALIFDPFPKPYIKIGKRKFVLEESK